jgi:hypothetical protein
LDCFKPLVIDDAALELNARQIAEHPLDPFGFAMFWYDHPQPANEVLTPPVFPYYWAGVRSLARCISVDLDQPLVWKAALFPWALLLTTAWAVLLRRFVGVVEPLLFFFVLSPVVLPALNLMLDLPALALGLGALALFVQTVGKGCRFGVLAAGLLAGLAMQTKFTAFVTPVLMLLYACLNSRFLQGVAAAFCAAAVFVAWEVVTWQLYGQSHFLAALPGGEGALQRKLAVWPFLLSHLGGLSAALLCLGLTGLGVRGRGLAATAGLATLGFLAIALFDVRFTSRASLSPMLFGPQTVEMIEFQLAEIIFLAFGAAVLLTAVFTTRRLMQMRAASTNRDALFLAGWVVLEILAYPAMSPFPAARRVLWLSAALTLLLGRLAVRRLRASRRTWTLTAIAAGSSLLGLAFWGLDCYGASVQRDAAAESARWVQAQGCGRGWFVGHWGFRYYAEQSGLREVIPHYHPPHSRIHMPEPSRLEKDDWLVVPDPRLAQQPLAIDPTRLELAAQLHFGGGVPLRTMSCYYGGRVPLEHNEGPLLEVRIYRVIQGFTPHLGTPPTFQSGY